MNKKFIISLFAALVISITSSSFVGATSSDTFITALKTSSTLEYVEVHNSSDLPINMDVWQLRIDIKDQQGIQEVQCTVPLEGWLRPQGYGAIADSLFVSDDNNSLVYNSLTCGSSGMVQPFISKIDLLEDGQTKDSITLTLAQNNKAWVRNYTASNSNNLRKTGVFTSDFIEAHTTSRRPPILAGGWYDGPPLSSGGIRIMEILPNSKNCSPVDQDIACGDYIKLQNQSDQEIDLSEYRLRVGYKGQSSSVSNTFTWNEYFLPGDLELVIHPGEFITVYLQSDAKTPIQITNSGGFAWLEDIYGAMVYEDSVVEYSDASADNKKGSSWALDLSDQQWKWGIPSPQYENTFSLQLTPGKGSGSEELTPCRADQFRNPETNRCKLIASASSTLKPCEANQTRNPETNRCRNNTTTASALQPCAADQFRNPETNRCKKISSTTGSLKPCKPGQQRNLETNRCRNIVSNSDIAGAVTEMPQDGSGQKNITWWIAGLAAGGAVLYGLYEWRTEVMGATLRLRDTFGKGGSGGE